MKEAQFYKKLEDKKVHCLLCPHNCKIPDGKSGICKIRVNQDGVLYAGTYGRLAAINFDPIEKKPLYHFYPGNTILSIGSVGCNFHCGFCQNCEISQASINEAFLLRDYPVNKLIRTATEHKDNLGIAYTYNEPMIWFEYMMDTAKEAKARDLMNVAVTNGYISQDPLKELLPYLDAFSVDLKAFTESFYRKHVSGKLAPVLETIKTIKSYGKHLEIINLIIPTLNDDEETFEHMVRWIVNETGKDTVMHLSRYFPAYKFTIHSTPSETIDKLYTIAKKYLNYVYIGNMMTSNGATTICPRCGKKVIDRSMYRASISGLDNKGNCSNCGHHILSYL